MTSHYCRGGNPAGGEVFATKLVPPVSGAPVGEPDGHAIGRSRGGLTTKIQLAADGNCRPLASISPPDKPVTRPPSVT